MTFLNTGPSLLDNRRDTSAMPATLSIDSVPGFLTAGLTEANRVYRRIVSSEFLYSSLAENRLT